MLHLGRPAGRLFFCLLFLATALLTTFTRSAMAADPAKTLVSDTLYRADGTAASGTLLISWPAFVSAEAISQREIIDEGKFRDGLSKIIDGTVQCLNASTWAKTN